MLGDNWRVRRSLAALGMTLLLLSVPPLGAQLAIGVARGSMALRCTGCATDSRGGWSGVARALLHVRPRLEAGLFSRSETHGLDETSDQVTTSLAVVHVHPLPNERIVISGGAGYGYY